jgi:hypothetical protein
MCARGDRQRGRLQIYPVLCRTLAALSFTLAFSASRDWLEGSPALSTAHRPLFTGQTLSKQVVNMVWLSILLARFVATNDGQEPREVHSLTTVFPATSNLNRPSSNALTS